MPRRLTVCLCGGLLLLSALPGPLVSQAAVPISPVSLPRDDKTDLTEQKTANEQRIEELEGQIEDVNAELADAWEAVERTKTELPLAEKELADATGVYTQAQSQYKAVTARLDRAEQSKQTVEEQIADAQSQSAKARQALGEVARQTMLADPVATSEVMLLLGASSLEDLDASYIAIEAISRTRAGALTAAQENEALNKNREARLTAVTEEVAQLQDQARTYLQQTRAAKRVAEQAKAKLDDLLANQTSQAQQLDAQLLSYKQQEEELEKANQELQSQLAALASQQHQQSPDGGPPMASGFFGRPLASLNISSPFGYRVHPILGYSKLHTGTDFSAGCGTPIYATASGTVLSARTENAWGNRVVIQHGLHGGHSWASSYNHMQRWVVAPGQDVKQGDLVGYVGTTGWSTGCHLHFEIYSDGNVVDPMKYL